MTYCVTLNLIDKKVLIIGGGKIAYRKFLQLEKQKADITVVSNSFLDDFSNHDVLLLHQTYSMDVLRGYFMVIAATHDVLLNHQIIEDANNMGLISQNVQFDENASCHPMRFLDQEHYQIAVSTKGNYPLLGNRILNEIDLYMHKKYKRKLFVLHNLRQWIINNLHDEERKYTLLEKFMELSLYDVKFILRSIQTQKAFLFAFHGVANPDVYDHQITSLMEMMESAHEISVCSVYLSEKIIQKANKKGLEIQSLHTMLSILERLEIENVHVMPMLLHHGMYEGVFKRFKNIYHRVHFYESLLSTQEGFTFLCELFISKYKKNNQQLLFICHQDICEKAVKGYEKKDVHFISLTDDLKLPLVPNIITIVPFFILLGHHVKKDIFEKNKNSVVSRLFETGYEIELIETSLLEDEDIKNYIIKNIDC